MDKYLMIGFLIGYFFDLLQYYSTLPIRNHWKKQCGYNCDKCKVWDCEYHVCRYKKEKLERIEKK